LTMTRSNAASARRASLLPPRLFLTSIPIPRQSRLSTAWAETSAVAELMPECAPPCCRRPKRKEP